MIVVWFFTFKSVTIKYTQDFGSLVTRATSRGPRSYWGTRCGHRVGISIAETSSVGQA